VIDYGIVEVVKGGGGSNREGKWWRIEKKLFIFIFWNCCLMLKENVIKNRKAPRAK
jgi:hypothetical protein